MPTIGEIASALNEWAPEGSAQSYDNVGLQVGDPDASVHHGLVALDLTPAVVEEAQQEDAQLIITHHPLLFNPVDRITSDEFVPGLILKLASAGISYYTTHTNLDAALGGVSYALADRLGLQEPEFLKHLTDCVVKLVTFVPADHENELRGALSKAGAGEIGSYDDCAFSSSGTGYFRPREDSSPVIGSPGGELESAGERRLEVEVARWKLQNVLGALHAHHPYDEVAYDVYPVEQPYRRKGLGVIGSLERPVTLEQFLDRVSTRLNAPGLRYAGRLDDSVERIAVCGGAGSDLVGRARSSGADAYVTADLTYHRFFDVLSPAGDPEMALIDAGHYETEAVTESLLIKWLGREFDDVQWTRTQHRTSPMNFFVRSPDDK